MITALGLGTGLGIGLWALVVGLFPPRPTLGAVLARGTGPPPAPVPLPVGPTGEAGWAARWGRPFVAPMQALGLPGVRLARDLAILDRPVSTHLAQQAACALTGLLAPVAAQLLLAVGGLSLGITPPVIAALVLAVLGFLTPTVAVRAEATRRRVGFRHALSAYLDLVGITLAGGAGVDSALGDSVAIGHGWAFAQLRRALDGARLIRITPWAALRQLGDELDVGELSELAASVSLAGTEGAKVRASLAAKAAALRTHQITDAEADAHAATERMSLPVMVLFLGFLIFLGFPALTQVLNGL
ncbi:MAG: type II secretion system F family protein [Pseudonocardiaceae bacterium]